MTCTRGCISKPAFPPGSLSPYSRVPVMSFEASTEPLGLPSFPSSSCTTITRRLLLIPPPQGFPCLPSPPSPLFLPTILLFLTDNPGHIQSALFLSALDSPRCLWVFFLLSIIKNLPTTHGAAILMLSLLCPQYTYGSNFHFPFVLPPRLIFPYEEW